MSRAMAVLYPPDHPHLHILGMSQDTFPVPSYLSFL